MLAVGHNPSKVFKKAQKWLIIGFLIFSFTFEVVYRGEWGYMKRKIVWGKVKH
jgi:predicted small integral membrane protein